MPMSEADVDGELWSLLDLANDEELEDVHNILYGKCLAHGWSPTRHAWSVTAVQHPLQWKGTSQDQVPEDMNSRSACWHARRAQPVEPYCEVAGGGQRLYDAGGHRRAGPAAHHAPHRVALPLPGGDGHSLSQNKQSFSPSAT